MKAYSPAEWVKRPWAMDDVFVQDRQPIPTLELVCAQEASTYKSPPEGRLHPLCVLGTSPASAAGDASRIHEQAQWPRIPDGLGSTGGPAQFEDDGPFQQPADWHPASQGALAPPVVIVSAAMERPACCSLHRLPACCIKLSCRFLLYQAANAACRCWSCQPLCAWQFFRRRSECHRPPAMRAHCCRDVSTNRLNGSLPVDWCLHKPSDPQFP